MPIPWYRRVAGLNLEPQERVEQLRSAQKVLRLQQKRGLREVDKAQDKVESAVTSLNDLAAQGTDDEKRAAAYGLVQLQSALAVLQSQRLLLTDGVDRAVTRAEGEITAIEADA